MQKRGKSGAKNENTPPKHAQYELWSGGRSHWQHMREEPELYTRFNK